MSMPIPPSPQFFAPLAPCNLTVRRCPVPREQATKRILILRAGAFGDILMGTPLLAALRAAHPEAHITWIVEHVEREAIDANPYVDEVVQWSSAYWKRLVRGLRYVPWLARMLAFRRLLRERDYDVFVSFQPEEWPLLALGAGAQVRVGVFDTFKRYYGKSRRPHYKRLYTHAYGEPGLPAHRVDQYLLTLEALGLPPAPAGPMSMGYTAEDAALAGDFLEAQGLARGQRFAVLAPMTTWPTKCWPPDRFVALADSLARHHNLRVVVIGSARERPALEEIAARMSPAPVVMAGELGFRQAAALIDRAALLVSGDTGPMHVAAALGTPQIALFGPTSPAWYGPRTGRALVMARPVPCGPCDRKVCHNADDPHLCMRLLSVDDVLVGADALLGAHHEAQKVTL